MKKNSGFSLLEVLVTIAIISIVSSSYIQTEKYLSRLSSHRLCGKLEDYLRSLRFTALAKNLTTTLLLKNNKELIGLNNGEIIFRQDVNKNRVQIKSGAHLDNTVLFYANQVASPATIQVSKDSETYCSISISLRGRIKRINFN